MATSARQKTVRAEVGAGDDARAQRIAGILDAALDLFAEHGVARVTIKDIGRACDMNAAMIYYYFENKEDLFRATIERAIGRMLARYRDLQAAHDDPVERIDGWFEVNVALKESGTKLAKIMSDYSFAGSRFPSVDRLIAELYARECAILEDNIAECVRRGMFQGIDAKRLAHVVSVHLDGIFYAAMTRRGADLGLMVSDLKRLLWDHLAAGKGR